MQAKDYIPAVFGGSASCFGYRLAKMGRCPPVPGYLTEHSRHMLSPTGQSQLLLRNPHSQSQPFRQKRGPGSHDIPSSRLTPSLAPSARCPTSCGLPALLLTSLRAVGFTLCPFLSHEPGRLPYQTSRRSRPPLSLGPPATTRQPQGPGAQALCSARPRGLRRPLTAGGHGPERRRGTTAPGRPCATARWHRAAGGAQHVGR